MVNWFCPPKDVPNLYDIISLCLYLARPVESRILTNRERKSTAEGIDVTSAHNMAI